VTNIEPRVTLHLSREDAAQTVGITITRIIKYERLGLVAPSVENRRARYGPGELARLRKIRRLTDDLGVNLAGVEIILRLLDQMSDTPPRSRRRSSE
jgi:MerR family transcriptional regulator, heat shock protein HspR